MILSTWCAPVSRRNIRDQTARIRATRDYFNNTVRSDNIENLSDLTYLLHIITHYFTSIIINNQSS